MAPFRTWGVAAPDSSERAKPTGTINAATTAASNRTRKRFRIARFLDNSDPGSRLTGPCDLRRAGSGGVGPTARRCQGKVQALCHKGVREEIRTFLREWRNSLVQVPARPAERVFTSCGAPAAAVLVVRSFVVDAHGTSSIPEQVGRQRVAGGRVRAPVIARRS